MVTQARNPHYLLFSEASRPTGGAPRWKFVLQSVDSEDQFAAGDVEPGTRHTRLELLAVVRGLEAIDQPSRVTLVTHSRYVARGIRRELSQWRERHWHWERFGSLVPIRDQDLWQRVDRALEFHRVECVGWHANSDTVPADATPMHPTAEAVAHDPALLIVPRMPAQRRARGSRDTVVAWALNRLCEGVLAPFSAILRPAFTRAA